MLSYKKGHIEYTPSEIYEMIRKVLEIPDELINCFEIKPIIDSMCPKPQVIRYVINWIEPINEPIQSNYMKEIQNDKR